MSEVTFVKGGTSGIASQSLVEGQILFDIENKMYYIDHVVNNVLTRVLMGVKEPFVGTQAEWDELSVTEKAYYADTTVLITDDYIEKEDVMEPATPTAPGKAGLVPIPAIGDEDKILQGDATWVDKSYWTVSGTTATFHR